MYIKKHLIYYNYNIYIYKLSRILFRHTSSILGLPGVGPSEAPGWDAHEDGTELLLRGLGAQQEPGRWIPSGDRHRKWRFFWWLMIDNDRSG